MGLQGEGGCPSEMKGSPDLAQGPAWGCLLEPLCWGVPAPPLDPMWGCRDRQSICLSLCPGPRSRATSSLPGGRQQIPAHPSAFRWSRQEPPQSCLEGIAVFEEARAGGWGELHSKQSSRRLLRKPLTPGERKREDGVGMSVLVHRCGSAPDCEPWSPFACVHANGLCSSGILALENSPSTQATSSQPHPGSYPLLCAPCLHSHANTPPHLHTCRTLHPHTHTPHPQGPSPSYMYAHYTHFHPVKPGTATHTCHIHASTHTYLTRSYHTYTHTFHTP